MIAVEHQANGRVKRRALVTGGTGFTGSHLVRSLLDDGVAVRTVTRNAARARALGERVDVIEGDLADRNVAERAVDGCEEVYHLAAAFREPGIRPRRYHEVHVDATRFLLEAARAQDRKSTRLNSSHTQKSRMPSSA